MKPAKLRNRDLRSAQADEREAGAAAKLRPLGGEDAAVAVVFLATRGGTDAATGASDSP